MGYQNKKEEKLAELSPYKQNSDGKDKGSVKVGSTGKEKIILPSFLEGFPSLTADDFDMIADFEEEQQRKGHFELIFPTLETIDAYGACF